MPSMGPRIEVFTGRAGMGQSRVLADVITRWLTKAYGVLVYARCLGAVSPKDHIVTPSDQFRYDAARVGDPMPAAGRPRGWRGAVLAGKAVTVKDALRLMRVEPTETASPRKDP